MNCMIYSNCGSTWAFGSNFTNGQIKNLNTSLFGGKAEHFHASGFSSSLPFENNVFSPRFFPRRPLHSPLALASKEPSSKTGNAEGENAPSSFRQQSAVGNKQAKLMEQNRRLMIMQKELLDQIEERKKLRMNMMQSLNASGSIQESKSSPSSMSSPSSLSSSPSSSSSSTYYPGSDNSMSVSQTESFPSGISKSQKISESVKKSSIESSSYTRSYPSNSSSSTYPSSFSPPPSAPPASPPSNLDIEFESKSSNNPPTTTKDGFSSQRGLPPFTKVSGSPSSTPFSNPSSSSMSQKDSSSFSPNQSPYSSQKNTVSLPSASSLPKSFRASQASSSTVAPPKQLSPSELLKKKKEGQTSLRLPKESSEKEMGKGLEKEKEIPVKKEPLAGPNVMNVVLVASECAPWSKTGGLGDVVGALPKALARRGHRVMAVAPRYANYEEAWDSTVRKRFNVAGQDMEVGYFHGYIDGVDYVFIDNSVYHHNSKNIYGGSREEVLFRMILLCKAAIEAVWHVPCGGVTYGDGNLVFIANDWHTALLPVYLQAYYRDHGLMEYARSVLVIHNMAHQGRGPMSDFAFLGLPDHYASRFELYDSLFGGEHMNIFMAGILSAQKIVAVSHGYAWECQTPEGGWGLDGVMREHSGKLRGVVNGIDDKEWNPELDVFLKEDGYENYSIDTLEGKAMCKAALQVELGLPVRADVPLVGFIGRLDHQKGVDIIADASHWMMGQDMQLVMLGTGRSDLEDLLRNLEGSYRDKVRGWVGFSVKMAHRITAGVDILLMPSRFEPCGLNQLYAMKYGTIPVVHSVGGLRDTVKPFDPYNNVGYGWTFDRAEAGALIDALGNSMYTYREFKQSWLDLQKRCMEQDLSWDNAAQQYEEVLLGAKYAW